LGRREIENYLLDFDVLNSYCASKGLALDRASYDTVVTDLVMQDLKAGQTTALLKNLCGDSAMPNVDFKQSLACHIRGTAAFNDLESAIFGNTTTAAS